jgi:hypothetical protein
MLKMIDLFCGKLEDVQGVETLEEAIFYIKENWCNDTDDVRVSLTKDIGANRTVDKYTIAIIDENGEYIDIYGLFVK